MCPTSPWQVIALVSCYLDPKTLAMASCVCKSWSNYLSADHLWKPICNAHFPSLSVHQLADFPVPYHRLYAIGLAAAKRRVQTPGEPRLSLGRIIFALNIRSKNTTIVSLAKPAKYLLVDPKGVFRFDIAANYEHPMMTGAMEEVRITWNVILRGWGAVFTMMDCEGKVNFSPGAHGWFSEELPPPGCCSSAVAPGIVSDVKIGLCTRRDSVAGKVRTDTVSVGILSIVNWRYVTVDDGLRYLQHFLLPCNM